MLIPADLRNKIGQFSLAAGGRVRALHGGRHPSFHKGESIDFVDFREYTPGDDYRRIDHHLWARLGAPLIREFEAERELTVRVVVDRSASMGFHGKLASARRLAGLITYLALAGGDRVELWMAPGISGAAATRGPAGRHLSTWPRLESWLEEVVTEEGEGRLSAGLAAAGVGSRRRYMVLVSDLLVADWRAGLDLLGGSTGGVVLQVLGVPELDPRVLGDVRLRDVETGEESDFSATAGAYERYRSRLEDLCGQMAARSARSGLYYLLVEAAPTALERTLSELAAAGVVSGTR